MFDPTAPQAPEFTEPATFQNNGKDLIYLHAEGGTGIALAPRSKRTFTAEELTHVWKDLGRWLSHPLRIVTESEIPVKAAPVKAKPSK